VKLQAIGEAAGYRVGCRRGSEGDQPERLLSANSTSAQILLGHRVELENPLRMRRTAQLQPTDSDRGATRSDLGRDPLYKDDKKDDECCVCLFQSKRKIFWEKPCGRPPRGGRPL